MSVVGVVVFNDYYCRLYLNAVRSGLCVVVVLLRVAFAPKVVADWALPDFVTLLRTGFPNFPSKDLLCSIILSDLPGSMDVTLFEMCRIGGREIVHLVKLLSCFTGYKCKNPMPRLLQLLSVEDSSCCDLDSDVNLFLSHDGVVHLSNAMIESCSITDNALKYINGVGVVSWLLSCFLVCCC